MRPRKPPRRRLTPEAIVDAAFAVLDEAGGIEGLNMRAVAERLGTGPASLYAHFAGKDELLAAMIDRIIGDLPLPKPGAAPWQDQFKDAMRNMRRGLAAHRDIAGASLGVIPTGPNAVRAINALLGVLLDAGLPEKVIAYALDVVPLFVTATAYEESLQAARGVPAPEDQWVEQMRRYWKSLPPDRFPHIVRLADPLTSQDTEDERFEFGLDALVRGIESMKG
jgi:AcrR family transcriptional regulator